MKVLQVGKFYYPSPGGIETVLRNLSEGLSHAGDDVTVLCSAEDSRGSDDRIGGVRILRAPRYAQVFSQPLSPSLPRDLRRLASQFDVVHVHSPNPLAETAALALPKTTKLVVSYHSDIVRQKLILPLYAPALRAFLGRAGKIIVATPNHIRHSPFLSPLESKCEVIPYGIDAAPYAPTSELSEKADALRKKYGPYALFVGRLVGYKGVHVLLQALSHAKSARAVIVGTGPLEESLKKLAADLNLGDRAHFAGYIDDHSLKAYFHGCELLVLPSVSKNEAFGLVQVEAMACGKPAIVSRLDSGITLVTEDGVTGVHVPSEDPEALAAVLTRLLSDPAMCRELGQAARKRFEEHFTRERMVEAVQAVYRRVIES